MKKISIVLISLMIFLSGCFMKPIRYETVPEIRKSYVASVPVVNKYGRAKASGTIIYSEVGDKFVVLTAAHVVDGMDGKVNIEYDHKIIEMDVLKIDRRRDLALVVSKKKYDKKLPSVRISKYRPQLGQTLWAIGSSWGDKKTVSRGVMGKLIYDSGYDRVLYRIDAAAFYGSSGCGVFNNNQELVGIVFSGRTVHPLIAVPGGTLIIGIESIQLFLKDVLPN
jgi:S1-C subfamily serine protease